MSLGCNATSSHRNTSRRVRVAGWRPAIIAPQVTPLCPSGFKSPSTERRYEGLSFHVARERTPACTTIRCIRSELLRARRERPRGRSAAEKRVNSRRRMCTAMCPSRVLLARKDRTIARLSAERESFALQSWPMSPLGSFTSFSRCPRYVRSSPNSGGKADVAALLIRAITGHRPTATRSPRRRPQAVCPVRSGRACARSEC